MTQGWTAEEDAILLASAATPHVQLALDLSRRFGRMVTVDALEKRLRRLRERGAIAGASGLGLPAVQAPPDRPMPSIFDESGDSERTMPRASVPPVDGPEPQPADAPYVPRPPRGPTEKPHYIPKGHELGGVSRLTDADGNTSAEWSKTRVAGADEPPVPVPPDFLLDRSSVMRRGDGSTVLEWASYRRDAVARWDDIKAAVIEHVAEYVRPAPRAETPEASDSDRLVAYPLGDPHIGMLAWAGEVGDNFDLKIAERELCECFRQLVARSPATEKAIVCNLGDFWHAQDDNQRTPKSGHKLDVDGRFGKVGRVGLNILRNLVDCALTKHAHVLVRSIPGNHDPASALWLPLYLQAVYENDPRVTVEQGFNPYQYDVFGRVLLGWAHGDGAKLEHLGEIMATDEPEKWGAASHRYWNTGHVHHWSQKELRGCVVDTHRTLAGRDAWHHHSGYRSGQALKAITYHRLYGLDSVAVVGIERVRAALEAAA